MNTQKAIARTFVELGKQIWALPKTISHASAQRKQKAIKNELEAERIDRICNPSKYRGK